eukprot:TRINITY_DN11747_c0_g2_i1.p3 TRINITY_DN11747_c0_g2~~TRINITY_DN11747_c0_g2_i1.p3  ORF type:complete len:134 (+),score=33.95 TRINITY_DN11747_c0_g2_i1:2808-3209(+)
MNNTPPWLSEWCMQENCRYAGIYDDDGTRNALYWEIWFAKLAFFIAFEHAVFFIRIVYSFAVSDVPKWVRIAKRREAFQARAIIEGLHPNHFADVHNAEVAQKTKPSSVKRRVTQRKRTISAGSDTSSLVSVV